VCEVRVEIPFEPTAPWKGAVGVSEVDDTIENMAHFALTSLCEHNLAATADTLIALFLIHNHEEPEWQQHHEAMCELTSSHFSTVWAQMAKYSRYLFNLMHNTDRAIVK
jgi:hypothetical protein